MRYTRKIFRIGKIYRYDIYHDAKLGKRNVTERRKFEAVSYIHEQLVLVPLTRVTFIQYIY